MTTLTLDPQCPPRRTIYSLAPLASPVVLPGIYDVFKTHCGLKSQDFSECFDRPPTASDFDPG